MSILLMIPSNHFILGCPLLLLLSIFPSIKLRILPRNIADMIAAGEVVQRPASVVKELMENAVDAGADEITVAVTDAGRTLIQVIDNG